MLLLRLKNYQVGGVFLDVFSFIMIFEQSVFSFIYFLTFFSALGVVLSPNPVHSILFLVLVFLDASALLVLTGCEFLGLVLIVVYVGAVAVLFLFVCMMLDLRLNVQSWANISYIPLGAVLIIIFLTLMTPVLYGFIPESLGFSAAMPEYIDWAEVLTFKQNIVAIASVLYSIFVLYFVLSSYILLLAMVGSISLTLWKRLDTRRQSIYYQVTRDASRSRVLVPFFKNKLNQ